MTLPGNCRALPSHCDVTTELLTRSMIGVLRWRPESSMHFDSSHVTSDLAKLQAPARRHLLHFSP